MKANEGRYIPLHKLYEIAAESGALLADLEEAEAKRSVLPDELYSQISKALAKHDYPSDANLAGILDILLSGISSEIETKEKYKAQVVELETELASARQQLAEAQATIGALIATGDALIEAQETDCEAGGYVKSFEERQAAQQAHDDVCKQADTSALLSAIAEAVEPYKRDAEAVALLATGEWELMKMEPCECFTEEANRRSAWSVKRQRAPYREESGVGAWFGSTPLEAFQNAKVALGLDAALAGKDQS